MWCRWYDGVRLDFTEDMQALLICEKMGWTWEQYQAQPSFFTKMIVEKMVGESMSAKKQKSSR